MSKRLIVCCDGTGNEINDIESNVLKFSRILSRGSDQITFYDPGVGTISDGGAIGNTLAKTKSVLGLALGIGLDRNILEAYKFLVDNYEDGDEIYLFGFSRGGYTVRVLAGFLHLVGLLDPHQKHLCEFAFRTYRKGHQNKDYDPIKRYHEILGTRRISIRFMGCWDTVASIFVFRLDRLFFPWKEILPFTKSNPSVEAFRHAMAIDEKRRFYRLLKWEEGQQYSWHSHNEQVTHKPQDVKQLWFSGVHSDVGGGYPELENGAAKFALEWMVEESREHNLNFSENLVNANADLHDSINIAWKLLEWLPKWTRYKEWPKRKSIGCLYLPRSEPRVIQENAQIHPSVYARRNYSNETGESYEPENLKQARLWPKPE